VAQSAGLQAADDLGCGGSADVGGEEGELEVVEGSLIDFARESSDGAERLIARFARAGGRLLHAVEETARLGVWLLLLRVWCRGFALAEEREGHRLLV